MQHLARKSFASEMLNSLTAQIAVLNSQGDIIAVNNSWKRFAQENDCADKNFYVGENYLAVCENALKITHDETAEKAYHGLQALIHRGQDDFSLEYPCNSPAEERWFVIRASSFVYKEDNYVLVSHENITARKKMEETLAESHERFRHLTQNLPDVIYTLNLAKRQVTYFNRDSFLGYSRSELISPGSITKHVHPEDAAALSQYWRDIIEGKATESFEYRIYNKSGGWEWIDSREAVLSSNLDGTPKEIMIILRLITDRKLVEEQAAYHARLLENVNDAIIGTDENFRIKYWNRAAEQTFGWKLDEMIGRSTGETLRTTFVHGGYEDAIRLLTETGAWKGEVIQYTRDNKPLIIDANIMTVRNHAGQITGYVSANRDITEKKQAQEKLAGAYQALENKNRELEQAVEREQQLARTDGLTGIYNHRHFIDIAAYEFAMAERYNHTISILIFDVDKFKQVNDTMGHLFGDEMLKHIAQVAKQRLRETDILARYGGEEFIVLLPNTNSSEAHVVAEDIRQSIAANGLDSDKGRVNVTISIGISKILPKEDSLEEFIRRADKALYEAKAAGRNCVRVYSADE